MIKLIIFFAITFVVTLFGRVIFAFYVEAVPVFAVLLAPLTWICVIAAVLTVLFTIIVVIREVRKHRND